ncbi:MAG: hypothetical protein A4S09_02695 [Proteobacteria bacterium SG_bin7]|nr:MAG: hypothetical protein A4S09_02695 [Proteobacteria bacterium SG_bin7]
MSKFMFSKLALVLAITTVVNSFAATDASKENDKNAKVHPLWAVTEGIDAPECTYYDNESKTIFVSAVGGKPDEKDGNGAIHKLDKSGKMIAKDWVRGLNAPKGLRAYKGTLWVSDIDQVIAINIEDGAVAKKIDIPGAKFLNDVAVDDSGVVFVSDTLVSRIYRIEGDKSSVFIDGKQLESPNGLLVHGNKLIVASWGLIEEGNWNTKSTGHIYSIGLGTKLINKITRRPLGHLDGLEMDSKGNFIVSDWMAGKVFRVKAASGKSETLMYGFKGSADIGIIPSTQILIVPRMGENKVTAYPLSKL